MEVVGLADIEDDHLVNDFYELLTNSQEDRTLNLLFPDGLESYVKHYSNHHSFSAACILDEGSMKIIIWGILYNLEELKRKLSVLDYSTMVDYGSVHSFISFATNVVDEMDWDVCKKVLKLVLLKPLIRYPHTLAIGFSDIRQLSDLYTLLGFSRVGKLDNTEIFCVDLSLGYGVFN